MQTRTAVPLPSQPLPGTLADLILPGSAGTRRIARDIALVVAGSLVVALFAQIKIPLGFTPVPITGQTFAVLLVGAMLGGWRGGLALALYAVEGAFLPFFAGGASGWFWLLPSGGYIVGFIPAAALVGWLCQRGWNRRPWILAAMLLGNAALYVPGLIQLNLFLPANVAEAWGCANVWQCGLLPFIAGDLVKLIVASLAVPAGWALLDRLTVKPGPGAE
jgi:biotin transport system substrate-specific component